MNKRDFARFLEDRIRRSGISARDVAKRAGLSHGLLSMLLSGKAAPSPKVGVLLAWSLNTNPANLYREILEFLKATDHVQDIAAVRPLDDLLSNVADNEPIWIYAPDDLELLQYSQDRACPRDLGGRSGYRHRHRAELHD
jgi:transcriptional regulator with XRE-family HTH domain